MFVATISTAHGDLFWTGNAMSAYLVDAWKLPKRAAMEAEIDLAFRMLNDDVEHIALCEYEPRPTDTKTTLFDERRFTHIRTFHRHE